MSYIYYILPNFEYGFGEKLGRSAIKYHDVRYNGVEYSYVMLNEWDKIVLDFYDMDVFQFRMVLNITTKIDFDMNAQPGEGYIPKN